MVLKVFWGFDDVLHSLPPYDYALKMAVNFVGFCGSAITFTFILPIFEAYFKCAVVWRIYGFDLKVYSSMVEIESKRFFRAIFNFICPINQIILILESNIHLMSDFVPAKYLSISTFGNHVNSALLFFKFILGRLLDVEHFFIPFKMVIYYEKFKNYK